MGEVLELHGAVLARQIRKQLAERGSARARIETLPVTVTEWRRIARAAARELGRPVQTLIVAGVDVTAILRDWPADDAERARHDAALRAAIDRVNAP